MAGTVTPLPTGTAPARGYTRRSILRGLGIGSATAVVAGTALLSYRVYDTAVLDPAMVLALPGRYSFESIDGSRW